jgi:hypothetical protein
VGKLQDQRAGWVATLDRLVDLLDDGTLDSPKPRERATKYKSEIAEIDGKLAAAARTSPTAALLATGRALRKRWEKLSPWARSQIIDEVAVVTVLPGRRGVCGFDPAHIDVRWNAMTALIGAVLGAALGRNAGRKLGAAVEQEIARQVAEEYRRQAAWAEYYRHQEQAGRDTRKGESE